MQYWLSTMLMVMVLLAASMALAGVGGIVVTVAIIALRTAFLWGVREGEWVSSLILVFFVFPVLAILLRPSFESSSDPIEPYSIHFFVAAVVMFFFQGIRRKG